MLEDILKARNIELHSPPPAVGSYIPVVKAGNLVFISGQLPFEHQTMILPSKYVGKVPTKVSIQDAQLGARQCVINAIAHLKVFFSTLDPVRRFVRVNGYVNCEATFMDHSKIMNGATDLLGEMFGEALLPSRIAIGVSSLPLGSAVEIDFICEI
jgi:enamine deaminase RidA (YjgF/YER057c/UK114 family)